MFDLSDIWIALFGATVQEAHEKELREREEQIQAEYDSKKEEESLFSQRLDEEYEKKKEQESRNWYNNEREQLEWEMQNAELYGYDKEDIQSRMDYLNEQEQGDSWYSNKETDY